MNGGIPSRGWLNAGNIPFDLKVKIGQHVEPYTIIPLLDGEVSGFGTLVTIDGVRGILTAAHDSEGWALPLQGIDDLRLLAGQLGA